jgi:hypothetical protein
MDTTTFYKNKAETLFSHSIKLLIKIDSSTFFNNLDFPIAFCETK